MLNRLIESISGFFEETNRSIEEVKQQNKTILNLLRRNVMTKLQEIFAAQEKGGLLIVNALNGQSQLLIEIAMETSEVVAALEAAKAGTATPEQLEQVLATATAQNEKLESLVEANTKISDSVKAIVPTLVTPSEPTPTPLPEPESTEPVTTPTVPVVPAPDSVEEVAVDETVEQVGLPDMPAIDIF